MNSPKPAHPDTLSNNAKTIPFPKPQVQQQPQGPGRLERLVLLEGAIRQLPTRSAIAIHCVNEPRALLGFEVAYSFVYKRNGKARMESASSVAGVDPTAPLVRELCRLAEVQRTDTKAKAVTLPESAAKDGLASRCGVWVPFLDGKAKSFGGVLYVRSTVWAEGDQHIAERVGQAYAHSIRAVSPPGLLRAFALPRWGTRIVVAAVTGAMFIPVPLTALAPFEVVADRPQLVTAPLDGVIKSFAVEPNTTVAAGQLLFQFDSTVLKSDVEVAQQKVQVAQAKLDSTRNGAFADQEMMRSLGIVEKELALAQAERDYSLALLNRVDVRAGKPGLVIFSSTSEWIGKPVQVGEKVIEIADPDRIAYRVELGVSDSIVLHPGNSVRFFLDAEPLRPRNGEISELSYHARPKADGQLAYLIKATPVAGEGIPRIGLRGTAQVSGRPVPFGFYVFRRPIAAVRQALGL